MRCHSFPLALSCTDRLLAGERGLPRQARRIVPPPFDGNGARQGEGLQPVRSSLRVFVLFGLFFCGANGGRLMLSYKYNKKLVHHTYSLAPFKVSEENGATLIRVPQKVLRQLTDLNVRSALLAIHLVILTFASLCFSLDVATSPFLYVP